MTRIKIGYIGEYDRDTSEEYYTGFITVFENSRKQWSLKCQPQRLSKADAYQDAKIMANEIIQTNQGLKYELIMVGLK